MAADDKHPILFSKIAHHEIKKTQVVWLSVCQADPNSWILFPQYPMSLKDSISFGVVIYVEYTWIKLGCSHLIWEESFNITGRS